MEAGPDQPRTLFMKRLVFLVLAIIIISFALAQPASADSGIDSTLHQTGTLTSTMWIGQCTPFYHQVTIVPYGNWGLTNIYTFSVPVSNTVIAYIDQITNTVDEGASYDRSSDMRHGPIEFPNMAIWIPGHSEDDHLNRCQTVNNGFGITDACTPVGYENLPGLATYTTTVIVGGWTQWFGPNANWNARVCPVWMGTPPEPCANSYLTNTHFYYNNWAGSATWTSSEYHLAPGGQINKTAMFSTTGNYSVTVYARAVGGAGLSLGISSTFKMISMPASSTFAAYSAVFTASAPALVYIGSAVTSTSTIDVDIVCITRMPNAPLDTSCHVIDSDFMYPTSWQALGDIDWSYHAYTITSGTLKQSVSENNFERGAEYSVSIWAKLKEGTVGHLNLYIQYDPQPIAVFSVTSQIYDEYTANIVMPDPRNGEYQITLYREIFEGNSIVIDRICFTGITVTLGPGPCGLSEEDMRLSEQYIHNGQLESGSVYPQLVLSGGSGLFGLPTVVDSGYAVNSWSTFGNFIGIDGLLRYRGTSKALGLIPSPLMNPTIQQALMPLDEYAVAFRVKRNYDNGVLVVNGQIVGQSQAIKGNWTDHAVYESGGGALPNIELKSQCTSGPCVNGNGTWAAVEIDDVAIVPGATPETWSCGTTITNPFTPMGQCINPHSAFDAGAEGWNLAGGATVGDRLVTMPQGSSISQFVKAEPQTGAWANKLHSIIIGVGHTIHIAARISNPAMPNTAVVKVGAFQPGSQDVGTINPTSATSIEEFTFPFTPTEANMSNDTINVALVADEGTGKSDIVVYQVCIRRSTDTIPPDSGNCVGDWHVGNGGDVYSQTITYPDFVYNMTSLISMKRYNVHAVGECLACGGILRLRTLDSNGVTVSEINRQIGSGAFDVNIMFDALPPPDQTTQLDQVRIVVEGDVTYSELCLTDATSGVPPILPPGPLPYPQCVYTISGQLIQGVFFGLPIYSVPNTYSGTYESDSYAAELIYNYAVFPLVCTTLSIADWQFRSWQAWKATFNTYVSMMTSKLDEIISILYAILAKIGTAVNSGDPWWLQALWALIELFLRILAMILELMFRFIFLIIDLMRSTLLEFKADDAVSFPVDCSGDGEYMCIALAGILSLQESGVGEYLNIGTDMAIAMLTIALAWWAIQQVRAMMQPGSNAKDE